MWFDNMLFLRTITAGSPTVPMIFPSHKLLTKVVIFVMKSIILNDKVLGFSHKHYALLYVCISLQESVL